MGLDLSLTATGMAEVHAGCWETDRVRSTGKRGDTLEQRSKRLSDLSYGVLQFVMGEERPALVVVESPSYASQHGSAHDRSGLWWLVMATMHGWGLDVATVSPNGRAKYGTGKGNADKKTVVAATRLAFPEVEIVDDNVGDAVLLAAMGARYLGQPVDSFTGKNLEAMDGAAWPERVKAA